MTDLEALRREHREWWREHRDWRADLDLWQHQIARVEAIAHELESALPLGPPLRRLREAIGEHDRALRLHEQRLNEAERREPPDLIEEHEALRHRHQVLRKDYETFRDRQQGGMAEVRRLARLLDR